MDRRSFFRNFAGSIAAIAGPTADANFRPTGIEFNGTSLSSSPAVDEALRRITSRPERSDVSTGFPDLDGVMDGLRRGSIVAIAGRPSMGTSTLALNMVQHIVLDQRLPVAVFSAPLSVLAMSCKIISALAGVDQHLLRYPERLSGPELDRISLAVARLRDAPLLIDDDPFLTASELSGRARDFASACGQPPGMVLIDQPKMLTRSSDSGSAVHMNGVMEDLAKAARELHVPIVVTTDVGRRVEHRWSRRPRLSDLRPASMPIARHADMFLLLYRDEVYDPDTPDVGNAEVHVAMNRNGRLGVVRLRFRDEWARFESL